MAHEISTGTHPRLMIARMYGTMDLSDIAPNPNEFKLDEGAAYVLIDSTDMQLMLPDNFLEASRKNILGHPNLRHMAIVTQSPALKTLANMVSKLLRKQGQLSMHSNFATAEAHLLDLIRKDGL